MNNPLADPYLVLIKVFKDGAYLKRALADTPVEPLNKARTVKICYGVMEKNIYLDAIIAQNAKKSPKTAVKLVIKIALYMLEFMQKRDYMVIDCAVELTKKLGKEGAAGFVNAFLRSYTLPQTPKSEDGRIALECSAPLWLVKKLRRTFKGRAQNILSAPSHGVCVRFVRGSDKYLLKEHENTPFEDVYIFKNFVRDGGFFAGDYTFQSVGSVAICSAVEGGGSLLDACAAPGGKSVFLSQKFKSVTSCEIHPHRVGLIEEYAQRMGAKNVTAVCADSSVYNPSFDGAFDAVLVDAPCSGTGVINENPDIKFFRREEDVEELAKTQLKILQNCARYVKKGGVLYYSTCSVLPEENDSIAHAFLEANPQYVLQIPRSPLCCEVTNYGVRFLPDISLGAGFYLTGFKRL